MTDRFILFWLLEKNAIKNWVICFQTVIVNTCDLLLAYNKCFHMQTCLCVCSFIFIRSHSWVFMTDDFIYLNGFSWTGGSGYSTAIITTNSTVGLQLQPQVLLQKVLLLVLLLSSSQQLLVVFNSRTISTILADSIITTPSTLPLLVWPLLVLV